jgi:hypothetical protein
VETEPPSGRPWLKILAGLHAGQVFALGRDETVIGCGRDADACIDDVGIGRRHARIVRIGGGRYVLQDLGSTHGISMNGRRVALVELADGDRVQLGATLVLRFVLVAADEEPLARKLYDGSTRDTLTRAYNRKYASEHLTAEVAYAHRHGTPLSLVMFDLDPFQCENDSVGHPAGDSVLRVVRRRPRSPSTPRTSSRATAARSSQCWCEGLAAAPWVC